MSSLIFGLLCLAPVFWGMMRGVNLSLYINHHAMIAVLGGTVAIFLLSTPNKSLVAVMNALRMLLKPVENDQAVWLSLNKLADNKLKSISSKNKLIAYAQDLWESGASQEMFVVLLSHKRLQLENDFIDSIQTLRNLSKYPPALGMTGTVVGLVNLFSNLGSDNKSLIGPSLALAMTATFFGLLLSNFMIMPIADRLHIEHIARKQSNDYIFQVLLLLNRGESLELIGEAKLNEAA